MSAARRPHRSSAAIIISAALSFGGIGGCHGTPTVEKKRDEAVITTTSASSTPVSPAVSDAAPPNATEAILTAPPLRAKSIGHTSVVFKVTLEGGSEAAFKPESRRGKTRYRGEIAAYRLGQALGLTTNVPPALLRRFQATELRSVLSGESGDLFDREVIVDAAGMIKGAIMPWIKGLEFLPLETPEWKARWQSWLSTSGALKEEDRALASQISTLIVFDTLTGNWDRWSGGNIGFDRNANQLLFIDNDGAFFDPIPAAPAEAQLGLLRKTDRFSRSFVARLRALGATDLSGAIGNEDPGVPLLSSHVLEETEKRRLKALSIIDAKIAAHGEKDVLVFD